LLSEADLDLWENARQLFQQNKRDAALKSVQKIKKDKNFALAEFYHDYIKYFEKAESYYLQTTKEGNKKNYANLGFLYQTNLQDFKKAENWYLKAAEVGDEKVYFNLGFLYQNNLQDFKKAESWYLKAAEIGDKKAYFNLAFLYHSNLRDFKKAENYYLQAIELGDNKAKHNLAVLYLHNLKNLKKSLTLAQENYLEQIDYHRSELLAELYIWDNKLQEALKIMETIWYTSDFHINNGGELLSEFFFALFTNHLYQEALNYFQTPQAQELNLKEKYKPLYYATLYFLRDKYPDEYLRMGSEIKETVEEIVKEVEEMREEFKDLKR
jgi:tetratricopeptide (TPR) repeat protein